MATHCHFDGYAGRTKGKLLNLDDGMPCNCGSSFRRSRHYFPSSIRHKKNLKRLQIYNADDVIFTLMPQLRTTKVKHRNSCDLWSPSRHQTVNQPSWFAPFLVSLYRPSAGSKVSENYNHHVTSNRRTTRRPESQLCSSPKYFPMMKASTAARLPTSTESLNAKPISSSVLTQVPVNVWSRVLTCVSFTGDTVVVGQHELIKPPVIVEPLEPQRVDNGERVTLAVRLDGYPIPAVKWYCNGREVQPSSNVLINNQKKESTLTVLQCSAADVGKYEVRAMNDGGEARSSASVRLRGMLKNLNVLGPQE